MANNITHVIGYRSADAVRAGAAQYRADGYKTVQIGPTAFVQLEQGGSASDWPVAEGQSWYVLIATKDPVTNPG